MNVSAGSLPIAVIVASMLFLTIAAFQMETKHPCAFIDTVNITGSYASETTNMSYVHDWMVIPRELVSVYDFIIQNGVRVPAERHLRACVCKLKPCIRFCCDPGLAYDFANKTCSMTIGPAMDRTAMDVMQRNGSWRSVKTAVHFTMHTGVPCANMRLILGDDGHIIPWTLFENGSIAHRDHVFTKHYCYTAYQTGESSWIWQPLACVTKERLPFVLGDREWTYVICLYISVICMAIVLFVYLMCSELRNTFHGVAIKAYSLCIIIGYSLLAHLAKTDPADMSTMSCTYIPCYTVLYIVLSFYILSFISFNSYLNFHGVMLTRLMFWLIFFPIVILAVGWSLFVSYHQYDDRPILGGVTCWFDPRSWSIMLYFYVPIFVACAICGLFYVLTLIRISERETATDVNKFMAKIQENRFKTFWKFFASTCAVWLVCMTSFVFNYYRSEKTHINYAVCVVMALHGFSALYNLIGTNIQIQNFLRRIEDDV